MELPLETESECLLYPAVKKMLAPHMKEACVVFKSRELVNQALFLFDTGLYTSLAERLMHATSLTEVRVTEAQEFENANTSH